jgi:hypothetical protein
MTLNEIDVNKPIATNRRNQHDGTSERFILTNVSSPSNPIKLSPHVAQVEGFSVAHKRHAAQ